MTAVTAVQPTRINRLPVANRGEIADRIFRAASELGLETLAVFAEEDKLSLRRFKADEAYQIGRGADANLRLGPLEAYYQPCELDVGPQMFIRRYDSDCTKASCGIAEAGSSHRFR